MDRLAVLVPKGVNLSALITFAHSIDSTLKLDKNYLTYLVGYVLSQMGMRIERKDLDYYVPIYSQSVSVRFSKHGQHIRALCERWIGNVNILFRKPYEKGKSYSYAISPYYQKDALKVEYITDRRLIAIAHQKLSINIPALTANSSRYHYLYKYFNPIALQINHDAAIKLCNQRMEEHKNYKKYLTEMSLILELHNGTYRFYHNPKTDGRIHTILTRIPKVYRRFIRYNQKQLVDVDLSNAALYFIALLLKKLLTINSSTSSLLYMFAQSGKSPSVAEVELLWQYVLEGNFYELFIPDFQREYCQKLPKLYAKYYPDIYTGSTKQLRRVVKKRIIAMLFANPDSYLTEQKIFGRLFPTILAKIQMYKSLNPHETFSHLLFQVESEVMLGKVARVFNRKYRRSAPIFTLHDCLITTVENKENLLNTMQQELAKLFGNFPNLEWTIWDEEQPL